MWNWNNLQKYADEAAKLAKQGVQEAQKGFKEASAKAKEAAEAVKHEYTSTFEEQLTTIVDIIPKRLFVMEYPQREKLQRLASRLSRSHGRNCLILNMSEQVYDKQYFQADVMDIKFRGLPAPPLELFFKLVISCKQWLDTSDEHVVVVHCFSGFTRSAMFCACYLYWSCHCQSTQRGLDYVCKKLRIAEKDILPTQKRYIEYFEQVLSDGPKTHKHSKYLTRVLITGIPNFLTGLGGQQTLINNKAPTATGSLTSTSSATSALTGAKSDSVDETAAKSKTSTADTCGGPNSSSDASIGNVLTGSGPGDGAQIDAPNPQSADENKPPPPPPEPRPMGFDADPLQALFKDAGQHMQKASEQMQNKLEGLGFKIGNSPTDPNNPTNSDDLLQGKLLNAANFAKEQFSTFKQLADEQAAKLAASTAAPAMAPIGALIESEAANNSAEPIFVPYLEIWHKEKLVYTSWNSLDTETTPGQEYFSTDSCVPFALKTGGEYLCSQLHGDVLLRVRHYCKRTKTKSSAFRLGFNTNYIPGNFIHFPNTELDTATLEFPRDGFVDLFFEDEKAEKPENELADQTEILSRARAMFEEIREEETERMRRVAAEEKVRAAQTQKQASEGGRNMAEKTQTEEEFERLQMQLGAFTDSDGAKSPKIGSKNSDPTLSAGNTPALDANDVYDLNDAVWSLGTVSKDEQGKLKEMLEEQRKSEVNVTAEPAFSNASGTVPPARSSSTTVKTPGQTANVVNLLEPKSATPKNASIEVIDMTTPTASVTLASESPTKKDPVTKSASSSSNDDLLNDLLNTTAVADDAKKDTTSGTKNESTATETKNNPAESKNETNGDDLLDDLMAGISSPTEEAPAKPAEPTEKKEDKDDIDLDDFFSSLEKDVKI